MEEKDVKPMEGFDKMSEKEQLDIIENVIDRDIRPMLAMDGGNMEIIDLQYDGKNVDVYIRYLGNCSGCAMGTTGTLFAIEGTLKKRISPMIRVLPV